MKQRKTEMKQKSHKRYSIFINENEKLFSAEQGR